MLNNLICRDNIVKNNAILDNVSSIIHNNKLTNSYIIEGLEGSGKTLLANYFAKALLCENFVDEPCCECVNCLNFENKSIPDIMHIRNTKKSLSIEEVRIKILENIYIKPQIQKYKIYIIESDEITVQAQNSLLKTIEQPPSYAIFIFMTSKINLFLPTILSRCTLFKTQYIDSKSIYSYLTSMALPYSNEALQTVSNFETGSIGQAIALLEKSSFTETRSELLKLITDINYADISSTVALAKHCEKYKNDIDAFYKILHSIYRDLFIFKSTKNEDFINQKDISKDIILVSENFELTKLLENFNFITNAINTQGLNNSFSLGLETLLLKLSNNI